jgi:hypothetical protein
MKKIALSLAGVLVAIAFAPEASAIPSFSRQTGKSCSSCHFQHFPVLNGTGQEFKANGFTQMNANGKFKEDDLSIPDTLNASMLLKAQYVKTNGTDAAGTVSGTTTNGGKWKVPDEFALFFGGRIAANDTFKIGFVSELALGGNAVGGAGVIGSFKIPVVVAAGDAFSVSVIPFLTDSLGQAYSFENSSTGMARGIRWSEHHAETAAARYANLATGAASGIAFVLNSDMGYINLSRWAPQYTFGGSAADGYAGVQMGSTWLRVAATPTIADWDMHIGVGLASGSNYCNAYGATSITAADECDTKGTVIDAQAQGSLGEMETSFYFQTATSPKGSATKPNHFNSSTTNDLKATTLGADVTVIPHTLSLGAAYRKGKKANAAGDKDDAITVQAIYDMFQNVALHAVYSKYSGPAYDVAGASNSKLTFMLESAW